VREQTRDLLVEAVVDNHDGALLPGMFVVAHLSTGVSELPVVQKRALVAGASTPSVFIVDGDRVNAWSSWGHRVVSCCRSSTASSPAIAWS
jgi:membrane fusion protein (multidrug efflux system)